MPMQLTIEDVYTQANDGTTATDYTFQVDIDGYKGMIFYTDSGNNAELEENLSSSFDNNHDTSLMFIDDKIMFWGEDYLGSDALNIEQGDTFEI